MTLPTFTAPLLLFTCVIVPVTGFSNEGDWLMARHDAQGKAAIRIQTPDGKRPQAWKFQPSKHVWGYKPGMSVWSSVAAGLVASRAVVLAGSYDRSLYCLDAITGKRLWRYTTGDGIYSAPVLWHGPEGPLVFFASSDRSIYALDATLGRQRWIHTVENYRPTIGAAHLTSPAVGTAHDHPALFVGHWVADKSMGRHTQAGGITALDALSGKRVWTTILGDNQMSWPIFVKIENSALVFIASENGTTYAIDANTGRLRWSHTAHNKTKASPSYYRAGNKHRIVLGSKHGIMHCLDALTGTVVWTFRAGHWIDGSAAIGALDGHPTVFFGSYDNRLYALDGISGKPLWDYRIGAGIYSSPAFVRIGAELRVLFSAWDHQLYALNGDDGALQWSVTTGRPVWDAVTLGDSIWASPSVAVINGHAVVYFGSYSGILHAIPIDTVSRLAQRPGTNMHFWIILPLVLLLVTALTIYLTRRADADATDPHR